MPRIPLPQYSSSRHPIETWQEWYRVNQSYIRSQVQQQRANSSAVPPDDVRLPAPYEYLDSLNQRQVWEPYLTGRERQEFDSQLRTFMKQNRSTMMRLRPGPITPGTQTMSAPTSSSSHHKSSSSSQQIPQQHHHHSSSSHHHHSSSSSSSHHHHSSSQQHHSSSSRSGSSSQMPRSSSSSSSSQQKHPSSSSSRGHVPSSSSSHRPSGHGHHSQHAAAPPPQYYSRH